MSVRQRFFILLSGVVFVTVMLYVYIYSVIDNNRLLVKMAEEAQDAEYAFKAEQHDSEMRMLEIATFVANSPEVQQLFLKGKRAVEAEGGGAGGVEAAKIRVQLYEYLRYSLDILASQFQFRQIQFHLGPGSLSFLRVHQVEKFGDRMDNVRFTVVDTNATQSAVTGFETGRVVSGLRGVVPVFAVDGATEKKVYVGALEAGTSFKIALDSIKKNRPWLNGAVLLSKQHLQRNLWPPFLAEQLEKKQFFHDMLLEATSSEEIEELLQLPELVEILTANGHKLVTLGAQHLNVCSFALRDYRGQTDLQRPDAGRVVLWQDVSADILTHKRNVSNMMLYGVLLFICLELLIYFGLSYMTNRLEHELALSLQRQAASDKLAHSAAESARIKGTFLSMMSHELLTPLNTIIGMGKLLSASKMEAEQQRCIGKINLSAQRLFNLIEEVLSIVKLEDSSLTAEDSSFSLQLLIKRVCDHFEPLAQQQAITLKSKIGVDVPVSLRGYPDLLERILSQLLGNAIKFSSGGEVVITINVLKLEGEQVTLEFGVTDQGVGIGARHLTEIFEPFYQVDSSFSRAHEGAGLGLHLAQKICQQLGCRIEVSSTVGVGSRFSFELQLEVEAAGAAGFAAAINASESDKEDREKGSETGSSEELAVLLDQLHLPLSNLQAKQCQQLAQQLRNKRWPATYRDDVDKLILQIEGYRFSEAQDVLAWLKKML